VVSISTIFLGWVVRICLIALSPSTVNAWASNRPFLVARLLYHFRDFSGLTIIASLFSSEDKNNDTADDDGYRRPHVALHRPACQDYADDHQNDSDSHQCNAQPHEEIKYLAGLVLKLAHHNIRPGVFVLSDGTTTYADYSCDYQDRHNNQCDYYYFLCADFHCFSSHNPLVYYDDGNE